jgi:hypothetical protein
VEALLNLWAEPLLVCLSQVSQLNLFLQTRMGQREDRLGGFWRCGAEHRHRLQLGFGTLAHPLDLLDQLWVIHTGGQFQGQVQFILEADFDAFRKRFASRKQAGHLCDPAVWEIQGVVQARLRRPGEGQEHILAPGFKRVQGLTRQAVLGGVNGCAGASKAEDQDQNGSQKDLQGGTKPVSLEEGESRAGAPIWLTGCASPEKRRLVQEIRPAAGGGLRVARGELVEVI